MQLHGYMSYTGTSEGGREKGGKEKEKGREEKGGRKERGERKKGKEAIFHLYRVWEAILWAIGVQNGP